MSGRRAKESRRAKMAKAEAEASSMELPWTPWQKGVFPGADLSEEHRKRLYGNVIGVWLNARYQVVMHGWKSDVLGERVLQLSIKRRDRAPIDENHWRELQRIKNELCGPEYEAVELFPAESRLVDTANQYHLWVLPEGMRFPFGYSEGRVISGCSSHGAVQRPWAADGRPADLDAIEIEVEARVSDILSAGDRRVCT